MTPQEQARYIEMGQAFEALMNAWWSAHMGVSPTEQALVEQYGEVVSYAQAAGMLGVSAGTVGNMCRDGRLRGGDGNVYTRSIAKHMDNGCPTAQRHKREQAERLKPASGAPVMRFIP